MFTESRIGTVCTCPAGCACPAQRRGGYTAIPSEYGRASLPPAWDGEWSDFPFWFAEYGFRAVSSGLKGTPDGAGTGAGNPRINSAKIYNQQTPIIAKKQG